MSSRQTYVTVLAVGVAFFFAVLFFADVELFSKFPSNSDTTAAHVTSDLDNPAFTAALQSIVDAAKAAIAAAANCTAQALSGGSGLGDSASESTSSKGEKEKRSAKHDRAAMLRAKFPPITPRRSPYRSKKSNLNRCATPNYARESPSKYILRNSSYPMMAQDSFRELGDFVYDTSNCEFNAEDVFEGAVVVVFTYYSGTFFNHFHPKIKNHYVLITAMDDASNPGSAGGTHALDAPNSKLLHWFTVNNDRLPMHPKMSPIPIGFESRGWWERAGNLTKLMTLFPTDPEEVRERFRQKLQPGVAPKTADRRLMYVNFGMTNPRERQEAQAAAERLGYKNPPRVSWEQYVQELGEAQFTMAPPGNGLDCHRNWEALTIGTVPVLKEGVGITPAFEKLPAIFVSDWDLLTPEFLDARRAELLEKIDEFDFRRLYMDFWIEAVYQALHPDEPRVVDLPHIVEK